jgi:transposase-like protein
MISINKFKSLNDLLLAFPTDESCYDHYIQQSGWLDNPKCPYCSHDKLYRITTRKLFKCAKCRKQISPTVGTIFEDTHIPMRKWFVAIYLITSHKRGVSSVQISKDTGVSQMAAWYMIKRIRKMVEEHPENRRKLKDTVESDETYVGGRNDNKHKHKKLDGTQGRSLQSKIPVLGMLERDGIIRALKIKNTKKVTLKIEALKNIALGTNLITDENPAYKTVAKNQFNHESINHKKKEYVRGNIHTNGVENFWSHFKRGIIGTYYHISPKHLDYYLHEFSFRYNTRKLTEEQRFNLALKNSKGKGRLFFKELTAFDPVFHNYSGRGVDYPVERLRRTKRRGVVKMIKLPDGRIIPGKRETFENLYPDTPIIVSSSVEGTKKSNRGRKKGGKNKPKVLSCCRQNSFQGLMIVKVKLST